MPTPPEPPAKRRFTGAAIAFGIVAPFLALEVGLRIWHGVKGTFRLSDHAAAVRVDPQCPWTVSADPELIYVNKPNFAKDGTLIIDAHGILRPQQVAVTKPPGTLRLAVIGDSVGAAVSLYYEQRAPTLIEARLRSLLPKPVEVLNFCVLGYDTSQEARLLEAAVTPFQPDAVLVLYCMNDPMISVGSTSLFQDPVAPRSYAIDLLDRMGHAALQLPPPRPVAPNEGPGGPHAGPIWAKAYEPGGEAYRTVERGFDRMAAWSKAQGIPVVVAILPLVIEDDRNGETTAAYRAQVAASLQARGIPSVSIQETFSAFPVRALSQGRADDIYHLSPQGHQVLADALVPHVRRLLTK